MATPIGIFNSAEVAAPPSPLNPPDPFPAIVLIMPLGVILRITLLPLSDIYRLLKMSKVTPFG